METRIELSIAYKKGVEVERERIMGLVDNLYLKYGTDLWGNNVDEVCYIIEGKLKSKIERK